MAEVGECGWCHRPVEIRRQDGKEATYCRTGNCRTFASQDWDRRTTWLLMEMVKGLWDLRGEGFEFKPRPYQGEISTWRGEFNRLGKWVRGLEKGEEQA